MKRKTFASLQSQAKKLGLYVYPSGSLGNDSLEYFSLETGKWLLTLNHGRYFSADGEKLRTTDNPFTALDIAASVADKIAQNAPKQIGSIQDGL